MGEWKSMDSAPRDRRVIVWTGQEIYCAHWSQNPITGDEAWIIAEFGDEGDQLLVRPELWCEPPTKPNNI